MSRQGSDIPIRPRYGLMATNENVEGEAQNKQRSSSGNAQYLVASSYSEIPFLAQYAGDVPQNTEATQSVVYQGSVEEEDDDDCDEDNSKESAKNADELGRQNRSNVLRYDGSIPYEVERASNNEAEMHNVTAETSAKDQNKSTPLDGTPSTSTGTGSTFSHHFPQTQYPQIDANALSDIELEAQYLAQSVDNLLENLTNLLHSISSITADNVEVHRCAVNKLTDTMDANIKCMYTIMAKTEEITKFMKPTESFAQRTREIKRLVDMLESTM